MANGRHRCLSRSAVSTAPHVDGAFHAQVMSANGHSSATDIASGVLGVLCAAFARTSDIFNFLECAGNSNHPFESLGAHDSELKHMISTDNSETFSDSESDVFWKNRFFGQKGFRVERGAECTPDCIFVATLGRTNFVPGHPESDKMVHDPVILIRDQNCSDLLQTMTIQDLDKMGNCNFAFFPLLPCVVCV